VVVSDGSGGFSNWPAVFTEIADFDDQGEVQIGVAWGEADGTEEGTTDTVTLTQNEHSFSACWSISGAIDPDTQAPEVTTWNLGSGTGTTINPPSISPTGGSKDYLFIIVGGADGVKTVSGTPANYSNLRDVGQGGGPSITIMTGERQLTTDSEDPGAWTITVQDQVLAVTIAIHPPAAGGPAIAGDVTVTPSIAATMAYNRNAALAGAVTVSAQVGATMLKGRAIAGTLTVTPSVTATTAYNRNAVVAGAVTLTPSVAATLDYARNAALDGDVTVTPTAAAGMVFQGGNTIVGDVTVGPSIAALLARTVHPALAGSLTLGSAIEAAMAFSASGSGGIAGFVTVTPGVAADLALNIHPTLGGSVTIGVTPAALGMIRGGAGSIVGRSSLAGEVEHSEMAGVTGTIRLTGEVA
jgi:hypothetical protein